MADNRIWNIEKGSLKLKQIIEAFVRSRPFEKFINLNV